MPNRQTESGFYLGKLRNKLISAGVLGENNRRQLTPTYTDEDLYRQALHFSRYIKVLLDNGVSPELVVSLFSNESGLVQLQAHLQKITGLGELTSRIPANLWELVKHDLPTVDRRFIFMLLQQDDALMSSLIGASEVEVGLSEDMLVKRKVALAAWLGEHPSVDAWTKRDFIFNLLSPDNPERELLFSDKNLAKIIESTSHVWVGICSQVLEAYGTAAATKLLLMGLVAKHEQGSTWGERIKQLDQLSMISSIGVTSYHQWEMILLDNYFTRQEVSLSPHHLNTPGLRRAAAESQSSGRRATLIQQRRKYSSPRGLENEAVYTSISRLEDKKHPTAHLFPFVGVEVEALKTPELRELYTALRVFVVTQGGGGEFEFSAAKVKRIETLITLYQRLFDANFIDLFWTYDYSLHWNVSALSRVLTIESHAMLLWTGFMSQGRWPSLNATDVGIDGNLVSKPSDETNRRLEWKQGDLINQEQFMMGAYFFHPLLTAQRAYEKAVTLIIEADETYPGSLRPATETFDEYLKQSTFTHLEIEGLSISIEEKALAKLYCNFRQEAKNILDNYYPHSITESMLRGTSTGMITTSEALKEVFPDLESFVEIDPEVEMTKLKPFIRKSKSARDKYEKFKIVAKTRKLTGRIMHEVHKIAANAEVVYQEEMTRMATLIEQEEIPNVCMRFLSIAQRFPCGQELSFMGSTEKRQIPTTQELISALIERYIWLLEDPFLDPQSRKKYEKAQHSLFNFWGKNKQDPYPNKR